VEAEIGRLGVAASRRLLSLKLKGAVSLAERALIEERLARLAPQLFCLNCDLDELHAFAAASDLDELGDGLLGTVAEHLKGLAAGQGEDAAAAALALRKLHALARRAASGGAA
jgi:hypothetical protein